MEDAHIFADHSLTSARSPRLLNLRRFHLFAATATSEIFLESFLFDFDLTRAPPHWQMPVLYTNTFAKIAVVTLLLFAIAAWPRRQEIIEAQNTAAGKYGLIFYLIGNLAVFATLLLVKFILSGTVEVSPHLLVAYSSLILATGASIALLAAPVSFWWHLLRLAPIEIAVALAGASLAVGAGRLAQEGWNSLSSATLTVSRWFLTLYEPNVLLDNAHRILGVGDFRIQVAGACSGYEGVALIAAFLSVYMCVFRRDLRFPNALLLFPIGIAAIWVLNALRIAFLVSIGAHASPTVAVQGFHSEGGWIGFLIVALAAVAVSRKISFFAVQRDHRPEPIAPVDLTLGVQASLELLAPFMALVAAGILASAFAPHDQWLYVVKVAAVGVTLWRFRASYLPLIFGASASSVAIGLVVGAIWIVTDPGKALEIPLGAWLAALPAWLAAVWLVLRAIGSILLAPVAEELAFRGYLSRALISIRFESVGIGEFRWLAFIGSSIAFGVVHQRWIAACLAGAVYALLMYRSKKLSDPITAHMASNAAIMGWAVATQQWSLF